jgi:hypothetical protein
LHNKELHILYYFPNIIRQIKSRRIRWAVHVTRVGEECVQGFDGKSRRKETTWKAKEDGIRMDLREIGWGSVDWIQLAQDRDRWRDLVNTVMNLRVLAPRSQLVRLSPNARKYVFCGSHNVIFGNLTFSPAVCSFSTFNYTC